MSENETKSVEAEISLLDMLIVLAKHRKMILRNTLGAAVIAIAVSFILPKSYTGRTTIMPPQQSQSSAAALLGQLGGLAAMTGESFGIKNPSDLYIGMLKSRTVEDDLIKRFDLLKLYGKEKMVDARKVLEKKSNFASGKDGIITIDFEDKDPRRAADIANAYVDELNKLTSTLAITEASQRRLFFEKQLDIVKDKLAKNEAELQKIQSKEGLIRIYPQEREIDESNAKLRAEIAAREVQLSAMQVGVTARNPDYQRIQQELVSLKDSLNQANSSDASNSGMTEKGLEYVRKFRDVKYNQAVMDMLYKQYEAAKIDEAKDTPLIQVIDKAVQPERRTKPVRSLIVVLSIMSALFISVLWAFVKDANERLRLDPENRGKFAKLRQYGFGKG